MITPEKLDNLLSHFWERERKEYLVTKDEHPIQIGYVVVMEEGNIPRLSLRLGEMEGLVKGNDNQVRGAHVNVAKANAIVQGPGGRLYKIKGKEDNVNSEILNKGNVNKESNHSENTSNGLKKKAAITWELKRKYTDDAT